MYNNRVRMRSAIQANTFHRRRRRRRHHRYWETIAGRALRHSWIAAEFPYFPLSANLFDIPESLGRNEKKKKNRIQSDWMNGNRERTRRGRQGPCEWGRIIQNGLTACTRAANSKRIGENVGKTLLMLTRITFEKCVAFIWKVIRPIIPFHVSARICSEQSALNTVPTISSATIFATIFPRTNGP